jgi:tRNA-Thr(GGU) m(6)t(6)A37 methyltransferase TsaA
LILEPIGYVESPVTEGVDEGWGSVTSRITVNPGLAPGLSGLESFSHVLVVYHMHLANFDAEKHLLRHPQENPGYPLVGIFAQRAKHRPNPIGVTAAEILSVKENVVTVRGLDAVDGTPVLDIKPYFPQYDSRPCARVPPWVDALMERYF